MQQVYAVVARYLALGIQFALVLMITHKLPQAEAGIYFILFGIVATTTFLVGLGLPDGIVKFGAEMLARGDPGGAKRLVVAGALFTAMISIFELVVGVAASVAEGAPLILVLFTAAWWSCFAIVFFCSQCLVAIRREVLGAFFFYTAINLASLVTSAPYLLLSTHPRLGQLLLITVVGAFLAALGSSICLGLALRGIPAPRQTLSMRPVLRLGWSIAATRVAQAALYWVPVWMAGILLSAVDASVVGAAGRLLIAVTGLIAAIRFSIRPEVVALAVKNDWPGIERLGRKVAFIATTASTVALLIVAWGGDAMITSLLGSSYAAVATVLSVLMVGAVGESFGGPVDEVLKLTGRSGAILVGLVVTLLAEVCLCAALASDGRLGIASAQSAAFCIMYLGQIVYLKQARKILIIPLPDLGDLRRARSRLR